MKFVILIALFAVALASNGGVPPPQYQLHIPDKCEDVLAAKVCDRLKNTAAALKLKSEEVKNAVIDAYNKGKQTASEYEKAIDDFLVNKVLNKKCEDFTSAENCGKLRKLAADAKIKAEKVKEFIIKQVAILKTKTCEDLLDVEKCNKIRDLTNKLKIKAEEVKEMVMAAVIDAKVKGTEKIVEVYNKIKDYVMSTRCEDMFNPDLCASFRKYAEKTKVALPKIMETAFDLVKKGVSIGKGLVNKVYDIVDYFYDCEDVFDQGSCDRLRKWAAKIKVTAEEVEIAVRKYVRVFLEKSASIYQTIREFVREKIICKFRPSKCNSASDELSIMKRSIFGDWKNKVRELINKRFPNLEENIRKYVEDLITKSKSLWQFMRAIAKEIKEKAHTKFAKFLKDLMEMWAITY